MKLHKQTTCGELIVEVAKENGKYSFSAGMKKFGNCSAYTFISKIVEDKLNSDISIEEIISELGKYKCKIGDSGCIEKMSECLKEFLKGNL